MLENTLERILSPAYSRVPTQMEEGETTTCPFFSFHVDIKDKFGTMSSFSVNSLRVLSLITSFISACAAFQYWAFTIYLIPLESYFHATHLSGEIIMAMNYLGFAASLPTGFMINKIGLRTTGFIGVLLGGLSNGLIYLSTFHVEFISQHIYVLCIFFFLSGCGSGVSYIVVCTGSSNNFPKHYYGKVMGLLSSSSNVGPIIFTFIYGQYFYHKDHTKHELNGYFLLLTITTTLAYLFPLFTFSHFLAHPDNNIEENIAIVTTQSQKDHSRSWKCIFKTAKFQCIFWAAGIMLGLKCISVGNLNSYLISFGYSNYTKELPFLSPSISVISKMFLGFYVDNFYMFFPESVLLFIPTVLNIISYIIAIFSLDKLSVIVITNILWTVTCVPLIAPLILLKDYDKKIFPKAMGAIYALSCFVTFGSQVFLGITYDYFNILLAENNLNENTENSLTICNELICFRWTMTVGLILTMISAVLLANHIVLSLRKSNDKPIDEE